jgi:hypothetical protein
VPVPLRRSWLITETLTEARVILRMYLDPRYRLSWTGRVVPLVLLALFFTTGFWLPLFWPVQRMVELLITFVFFKVLGHEARRYRETAPDLPPTLRL